MSDPDDDREWPPQAGEMAARLRAHDWAGTSLGPLRSWSPALRTIVELVLDCPTAMIVLWGPHLVQIYNDACRQLLSVRHPAAFGVPARETWSDVWAFDGELMTALRAGTSRHFAEHRLQLQRNGEPFDGFFDLGFSPLRDEDGHVAGVLVTIADKTEQVMRVQRQKFRIELEQRLRTLRDPRAIMLATAEALGRELQADEVLYADIEPGERFATIEHGWAAGGAPQLSGHLALEDFGADYASQMRAGEIVAVADVETDRLQFSAAAQEDFVRRRVRAFLSIPLMKDGALIAGLGVHSSKPRAWSLAEMALAQQASEATWAAVERARAEAALRASEERLRLAMNVGRLGSWDWDLATGEITWSDEHYRIQGYELDEISPSYEAWVARVHPDDRAATEAVIITARDTGREYVHVYRAVHPDGSIRFVAARGRFFYNAAGTPLRMIGVVQDITEERRAADTQALLIGELQHRTRNLLAVVQSIAVQIAASSASLAEFRPRFSDRLAALSRVQGLLSRSDRSRVTMAELVRSELEALGAHDGRVQVGGPEIGLRRSAVQTLALALHELATNARKYGALRDDGGTLEVRWQIEGEESEQAVLQLDWIERVPPRPLSQPAKGGGYGRRLIEQALPYSLNAKTDYRLHETGLDCRIRLPLEELFNRGPQP